MKGQTEGRIIHYVMRGEEYPGAERAQGKHRPAIIVASWGPGCVNAQVFLDGSNDGYQGIAPVWLTSIIEQGPEQPASPGGSPWPLGTWHEPQACVVPEK